MMATFKESHDVRFFKGAEGLKSVFEDIIRTGEDYIGYGPINEVKDVLKHHYTRFIQKRNMLRIHTRLIDGEGTRREKPNRYSKVRYIPQEYISKAALRIYGNKTAIMLLSKDPIAIVIKNQDIADGYRKYFEIMWQSAKE
jgi:HTH-type transcriptional regulator, sugar sensing transcriptional regulator